MADEYGGHEDFKKEEAALRKLREEREKLASAEAAQEKQSKQTAKSEKTSGDASEQRKRARKEAEEVERRASQTDTTSTKATKADTRAIEENTRARQRASRARAMSARAIEGAMSPQFAGAYRMMQAGGGAIPSQYAMRKQLEGVGSRRARAMQEALRAGLVPSTGAAGPIGPLTRVQAAQEAVARADHAHAQASKAYTDTLRKGTAGEAVAAAEKKRQTGGARTRAQEELTRAQAAEANASRANAARIREESAARQRVAREAREAARVMGVPPGQRQLPAPGQTVQGMPVVAPQVRTAVPISQPNWVPGSVPPGGGAAAAAAGQQVVRSVQQQAAAAAALSLANARAAESQGRLRDAARIYNNELRNPARAAALLEAQRAQDQLARQAAAQQRVARANMVAGASFMPVNQQMHRHGALTSEFIMAAARGETTLREMGNQAAITAGKFAGWTVAAAGVYGLAAALMQVGKGAMEASSGVQQAFRVIDEEADGEKLSGDFSNLSKKFNVDIATSADAVYRMGQVFHKQGDAVKAAEASLYSFKTGEVSVEDSTKNLIAIVNAFGLSSTDLVSIFDQINEAQNQFGISIGDTEAGLAKAGGTWKAAGGDLSELLAMFIAIQKTTGRSGQEIGTAMSRLYYVSHPSAAKLLQGQGVDVNLRDAQATFQSVIKRAREGADVRTLARGLLGNQYARMFEGVLSEERQAALSGTESRLEEARRKTSPEASRGSAEKELQKVLSQVNEQLKEVGNNFQRIGEALAKSGAFQILGLMLKMLNQTLNATSELINVFNLIPAPLRQALMVMGQLYLAMLLLRKVGATQRFAGTALGPLLADSTSRARTNTIAGLRQYRASMLDQMERAGQANVGAHAEAARRRAIVQSMGPAMARVQRLDPEDPERRRVQQEYNRAVKDAEKAERRAARTTREFDASRRVATDAQRQFNAAQRTNRRNFDSTAARYGWVTPRQLDQPNTRGVGPAGAGSSTIIGGFGGAGAGGDQAARRNYSRAAETIRRRTATMAAILASMGTVGSRGSGVAGSAAMARALGQAGATVGPLGRTGTVLARAATVTGAGLARGAAGVGAVAGAMRGLGGSMANMYRSLGALDKVMLAAVGILVAKHFFDKLIANTNKTRETIEGQQGTLEEMRRAAEASQRVLKESASDQSTLNSPTAAFTNTPQWFVDNIQAQWDNLTGMSDSAKAVNEQMEGVRRQQKRAVAEGRARPLLTYGQLIEDVEKTAQERKLGLISQAEFDKRMEKYAIEAKILMDSTKERVTKVRQAMADAARATAGPSYDESLLKMPADEFSKEMQGTGAAVELYGLTPHNMDYLRRQYEAAEKKYRNSNKPDDLIALNNARNAYMQAIIGEVNKELQLDLLMARSEQDRRAAYAKAADRYKEARVKNAQQAESTLKKRKDLEKEKRERRRQEEKEDQGGSRHQAGTGDGFEPGSGPSGNYRPTDDEIREREDKQRQSRRDRAKRTRQAQRALDKELERQNRDLTLAQAELKQAAYDDRQQGREILAQLQIAGTQDPMRQAAIQIDMARRQVQDAQREYGTQSRQYRQALTALRQAQTQQAQAILAGVQADNAILLAKAGDDPVAQANAALQAAQAELQTMQADPKNFDPNAVKQQRANVINAERAARNARVQQAQDLIRLQGELAAARAGGDPVIAARAAIRAAQVARANARTDVEKLQALVDLANANNQLQDALAQKEISRFNLLKSQTDDPVEQARLDLEQAKNALKNAKGFEKEDKQADYNNAKRAYQDAQIAAREDDINFMYQMDQITADEAAKQLEALANMKGISKAKKRELLLQAKQLRDEASGDYELDVGSIRLPSLYEVRRFVQGGQPNASQIVTDNRSFVVQITTPEAANAFGQQLELTNGTAAKAAALSMQMR